LAALPENFQRNLDRVRAFAARKDVAPAELARAWLRSHANTVDVSDLIPILGATKDTHVLENCRAVSTTAEEKEELDGMVESLDVPRQRQIPRPATSSDLGFLRALRNYIRTSNSRSQTA